MRCPLSAFPVKAQSLARALSPENSPNQRQLFARRSPTDLVAVGDEALRFGQLCAAIVMNCGQWLAFFYAVSDAFVEFEADCMVDGIFLFFAAAAEHGEGGAKLLAVCCRDETGGGTKYVRAGAGSRKKLWFFDNKIVTALKSNTVLESFHGLAGCDHGFSEEAAFFEGFSAFA